MTSDEKYLQSAIRLAMNGRGRVEPNPMVGCVIVKDGQVIGQGYHAQFGGPHAEPTALASCTQSPQGASAYVTLEPCCHLNKKTPPCAPQLIKAKLARVVIGCLDPNPDVNGKGVKMLRDAGIIVDGPLLQASAHQLIAPFLARVKHDRPYVTMKWAQTADGKIAGPGGSRLQIGNETSQKIVHQLRSRVDAIVVGIGTVLTDDPMLTARDVPNIRPLLRCVLDHKLRIPLESKLIQTARESGLIIVCDPASIASPKAIELRAMGVQLHSSLAWNELVGRSATHVLVEPGPRLARSLFGESTVDRLWIIRSAKRVNDDSAPAAAEIPSTFIQTASVDLNGDVLSEYLNTASDAFYASEASADLYMAEQLKLPPVSSG